MGIVFPCFLLFSLSSGLVEEIAVATNVYAKIGSEAVLPCEWADDSVKWYGIGDHQYSTGTSVMPGLPFSLRQRLHVIENNGFSLGIRDIHKDDEGTYKCISDNGTIHHNLYLIVAPTSITFPNSSDENVITTDANEMFNVTCNADGGFPPPILSLIWNETLLTSSETRTLSYAINLTRTDDFTNVTCTANHSELNHPLDIHAIFYLNLSPTHLTMMELPTLFEGKSVNISCISLGSRPQASCEWTIDGVVITNSSEDQSEIMNPTETYRITSILSFEFTRLQNRKELSCRSSNLADTKGRIQTRMLEIYYHPSIHITYKNTTDDDAFRKFTCKPNGNPAVYEFYTWEHFSMYNQFIRQLEGRKTATEADEVILPMTNLNERYQDSGIYMCRAQNDIADRYGNKMQKGFVTFISEGTPAGASENVYSNKGKLEDDTILIVKFVSQPAPKDVFWFKIDDGRDILINNSKKYTKVITPAIIEDSFHGQIIHVDGYIISLYIRNLEVTDFSKYNCEVHNRHGNMSLTVELVQTSELGNVHEGGWQTAGIVLVTFIGLVIVVIVALFIYKKRKDYNMFSESSSLNENIELNVGQNLCHFENGDTVDNDDGSFDEHYMDPENEQQHDSIKKDVQDFSPIAPDVASDERYIDDVHHPQPEQSIIDTCTTQVVLSDQKQFEETVSDQSIMIDTIPLETFHTEPRPSSLPPSPSTEDTNAFGTTPIDEEYSQPTKTNVLNQLPDPVVKGKESLDTTDSIFNQPKCLPTGRISSERKQTIRHPTAMLGPSPTSSLVEDTNSSSGFASFHGPDSMDQEFSIPRPIQHLSQDRLEEDESTWDETSNLNPDQEDEAIAIDNPSYQEKDCTVSSICSSSNEEEKEDDFYHDGQSKPCEVSSVSSEDVCSQEKISTEAVHPPTTNTDKKKTLQYYPTFPKLNNSEDEPWTQPAEPIKVLDASQEETQPMELNLNLTDHNDEDKTDLTSEDNVPETQN